MDGEMPPYNNQAEFKVVNFRFNENASHAENIPSGMIVAGLHVPPHALYGYAKLGEDVWGPRPEDKIGRLRVLGENWDARQALIETLYYRWRVKASKARAKAFKETREGWTDGKTAFDFRFPTIQDFVDEFGEDSLIWEVDDADH